MRASGSKRLVASLLVCLAGSACTSCYKSYVRAHVPRCDPMSAELLEELLIVTDSPAVIYTADKTIPYCAGIDALLDE